MIVLGIHEGHDAGAAIIKDGKILSAVNEERLVREKLYTGIPKLSIEKVIELANISPAEIDRVAIAGTLGLMAKLGWEEIDFNKKLYQFICKNFPFLASKISFANLQRLIFKPKRNKSSLNYIRSLGITAPASYIDHHLCHAASAYYTSGKNKCLIITSDGSGDGLSSSVYIGDNGLLKCIKEIPTFHSIAYYYAYITTLLGWKMFKHEGKVTGLAAYGSSKKCYHIFEKVFDYDYKHSSPINKLGLMGHDAMNWLTHQLAPYSREDIAAAVQQRSEDISKKFALDYINKTKITDISVAGGLFANVRINQAISESPEVTSFFVHPHMGDGGIGVGAALYICSKEFLKQGKIMLPYKLEHVYFGPSFTDEEIEQAIKSSGLKGKKIKNIEEYVVKKLLEKKAIGYFDGKMEYGPRALGNRSILYDPTDNSINDWLNKRLHRTETMPFAPSVLDTGAPLYYENYAKGDYPARFMTITFNCTKDVQKAKAVVHLDNTTRPQVVSQAQNPRYYKILQLYKKATGLSLFVNTSFNIHEEPIVCSPEDAIRSFKLNSVDILVMGNWAVEESK